MSIVLDLPAENVSALEPPAAAPETGLGNDSVRADRAARIREWMEFIRENPNLSCLKTAVEHIFRVLAEEFPPQRYETDATEGLLEAELPAAMRGHQAVVVAFVEEQPQNGSLWSWTVHLVEMAGVGVKIDDVVACIRTRDTGTWRTHGGLRQPLLIEPFGRAQHTWSCLRGPWEAGEVALSYLGCSVGDQGRSLVIRCPVQYPG